MLAGLQKGGLSMDPKDYIGHRIKRIDNLLRRRVEAIKEESLGGSAGRIMGYICHHQDRVLFQKDIEAAFSIRRSTATGILQRLEREELIIREPVDYDARLKKIVLTEKALRLNCRIEHSIHTLEKEMVVGISPEDLNTFCSVSEQIIKNLQNDRIETKE